MTEDIVDTAIGSIILAITIIIALQIIFPGINTTLLDNIVNMIVAVALWVILIALLVKTLSEIMD